VELVDLLLHRLVLIRKLLNLVVDLVDVNKQREIVLLDRLEMLDKLVDVGDASDLFNLLDGPLVFFNNCVERVV
jgi:hypothetical protein